MIGILATIRIIDVHSHTLREESLDGHSLEIALGYVLSLGEAIVLVSDEREGPRLVQKSDGTLSLQDLPPRYRRRYGDDEDEFRYIAGLNPSEWL